MLIRLKTPAIISIVFLTSLGLILHLFSPEKNHSPQNSTKENKNPAQSSKEYTPNSINQKFMTQEQEHSKNSKPISLEQLNQLNEWLAETGIPSHLMLDAQGRIIASDPLSTYKERPLDQLRVLIKQGDRKAQLALSHLLMEKHAAHFSNDNPAVQEAQRNIEALAVYGNTHSILQLSASYLSSADRLAHKEGKVIQQADTDSIRNFYKYIYFAQKRGAQDVSQFEDLQKYSKTISSLSNIEEIKKQALADADELYQRLENIRAGKGLPPFNNQQPLDIARTLNQITSSQTL